jgi:hypothetical protein
LNFRPFTNVINFWGVLVILNKPYIIILNLYYCLIHFIYIFIASLYLMFFQINVDPLCILIHIFWNLNISIMTMLKPSKISFSLHLKILKIYFSIWITNTFCVCNMVKYVLNILWDNHKNYFQKWIVMIKFYVYFVQNGTTTSNQKKWMKIDWTKNKHNILNFFFKIHVILHMLM